MDEGESLFKAIAAKLAGENDLVGLGRMMSSPGIRYGARVFAFFYRGQMVFRLGKGFDPTAFEVRTYNLLNPFKRKGPMAGWYQVSSAEGDKWEALARHALRLISQEVAGQDG